MVQDKAQSEENGESFSRTTTPDWIIWFTPFGRSAKHSSALLSLLAMASHCLRGPPNGQMLRSTLIRQYYVEEALELSLCAC
jgi:hypothetical protein